MGQSGFGVWMGVMRPPYGVPFGLFGVLFGSLFDSLFDCLIDSFFFVFELFDPMKKANTLKRFQAMVVVRIRFSESHLQPQKNKKIKLLTEQNKGAKFFFPFSLLSSLSWSFPIQQQKNKKTKNKLLTKTKEIYNFYLLSFLPLHKVSPEKHSVSLSFSLCMLLQQRDMKNVLSY